MLTRRNWATNEQFELLATAITPRLDYAFSFDWHPDWVEPGGIHSWSSADGHHARCGLCLADSPPFNDHNPAVQWARDHGATHDH